jgi:mRNA interferase RelE/StbE
VTYSVFLHPKAAKELQDLDEPLRSRVKESLMELRTSPTQVGKQLKGSKYWSLRVGDYRVIYQISGENSRVVVLFIGHRSDVYDDFSRAI